MNAYEAFLTNIRCIGIGAATFRPTGPRPKKHGGVIVQKRRSRDCNVTGSNENSLKKLTHYGDRDDTPLGRTSDRAEIQTTNLQMQ